MATLQLITTIQLVVVCILSELAGLFLLRLQNVWHIYLYCDEWIAIQVRSVENMEVLEGSRR